MKYIALLRGINVGGNHTVEMKKLKNLFEALGCTQVSTYINSGNILFSSTDNYKTLYKKIEMAFKKEFKFAIPLLLKTESEIKKIAKAIPSAWQNNTEQKTDVAYLFPEADSKKIINELPVKKEFINLKYIKGALIWNVKRENINKSRLTKIISHKLYKLMTVRNVNTARYLANNKN